MEVLMNIEFRKTKWVALTLLLGFLMSVPDFVVEAAPDITVKVDGNTVKFPDQLPYIDSNDRTMVPARAPMEAMDCQIGWNDTARQAAIIKGETIAVFTIGSNTYTVNGQEKAMDTQAVIAGNRTAFPIRFAAEAMGATVTWDQNTYTVNITTGKQSGGLVEPKIRVTTGDDVGTFYMNIVAENGSALMGKGYKFRVECTNYPEFNTMVQRVPVYGPAKYRTVKMDDWAPTIDWFIGTPGTWGCTYDLPAKPGQEIEYRITMKDENDQIVRIWEGKATLSTERKNAPVPTLVKWE